MYALVYWVDEAKKSVVKKSTIPPGTLIKETVPVRYRDGNEYLAKVLAFSEDEHYLQALRVSPDGSEIMAPKVKKQKKVMVTKPLPTKHMATKRKATKKLIDQDIFAKSQGKKKKVLKEQQNDAEVQDSMFEVEFAKDACPVVSEAKVRDVVMKPRKVSVIYDDTGSCQSLQAQTSTAMHFDHQVLDDTENCTPEAASSRRDAKRTHLRAFRSSTKRNEESAIEEHIGSRKFCQAPTSTITSSEHTEKHLGSAATDLSDTKRSHMKSLQALADDECITSKARASTYGKDDKNVPKTALQQTSATVGSRHGAEHRRRGREHYN